jgi:hypothetical protein
MITENLLIFYAVLAVFFFLFCYFFYQVFRIKKRLDLFFKNGDKDIGEVLVTRIKKLEDQEKDIEKIFGEIEKINKILETCFQKVGVMRYNPFQEVGGAQSFSIALLDAKNNGFIITGLYTREGNRIFAKPIENGQSKYLLSDEEREAIKKAIG